jgi:LacI family transcriptional regulator
MLWGERMPTIADVAAEAGVGLGTVSRVLNGSRKVRDDTRARVQAAIQQLGYRPNPLARGLSRGRCQTIGVVIPSFTHASAVERLRGVVAGLDGSRYDLVLFNVEQPLHRDEHLAALTGPGRADGVLVVSLPVPRQDLDRLRSTGTAVVLVDSRRPGVPSVVTDDVEGGRMATHLLLSLGHRSIGFIGDDPRNPLGFRSSRSREQGYESVLVAAGLPAGGEHRRYAPHDRGAARAVALDLLEPERGRPTAVFASSDVQAIGVMAAATDLGLRVPDDLSVIGFDDIELSEHLHLSTIRQPLFESGRQGVELLLAALADPDLPPRRRELPLELVQRATTGPPRARSKR